MNKIDIIAFIFLILFFLILIFLKINNIIIDKELDKKIKNILNDNFMIKENNNKKIKLKNKKSLFYENKNEFHKDDNELEYLVKGANYSEYSDFINPSEINLRIVQKSDHKNIPIGFNYAFKNSPAIQI